MQYFPPVVVGKDFERISPCFLSVIRLNILRFNSKKGGEGNSLVIIPEDKNKK
jgi:hypothetical protein